MTRPDLEEIGKPPEALERVEELPSAGLHGAGHVGGALEQIGAPHVAHEKEVAGEGAHRLVGGGRVGDQKGERAGWEFRHSHRLLMSAACARKRSRHGHNDYLLPA